MHDWHPISTAPLDRNLQLSVHENEEVLLSFSLVGGQKADGCMPQRGNQFSSILRTGVSGWTEIRARSRKEHYWSCLLCQQLGQLSLLFGEQLRNGLPL